MNQQDIPKAPFFLISGPCAIEGEEIVMRIAEKVKTITSKLEIPYIFKGSYRKANRSRLDSFTGIGDEKALRILEKVKTTFDLRVTSDVHQVSEVTAAAEVLDILQIPAFLCRQTDLVVACAKTGKTVNIKKGQFLSPESMQFAADKVSQSGNTNIMLTERGNTFGYSNLVVDFRSIPKMQSIGYPVVMDCTHSLQEPNQLTGVTDGDPTMIQTIVNAAIASGTDGLFLEVHPDPSMALSDGANMLHLDKLEEVLTRAKAIHEATHRPI